MSRSCETHLDCAGGEECVHLGLVEGSGECRPECHPSAHEVESCELGEGGNFDYDACDCQLPCEKNKDCDYGFECGDEGLCEESECYRGKPRQGISAKSCDPGEECTYGSSKKQRHGNGECH